MCACVGSRLRGKVPGKEGGRDSFFVEIQMLREYMIPSQKKRNMIDFIHLPCSTVHYCNYHYLIRYGTLAYAQICLVVVVCAP